ncbi:MAG: (deoxy)nucleoside triphosphate pyrophosphohydrolase [Firmicutes bacterium]|jgi:8-oxo-dGTP diphosphatase|nr:(deoxy)nucleoside triphosphate pyrophosphohydrolase [Bacillota bacterium]
MPVPVMAAIIRHEGKILICQRKSGALAGKWEFPGGKLENGESPEECLVREIREELDVEIEVERIYKAVNMHYSHGDFLLLSYLAKLVSGEISLVVHQDYAWVEPRRLMEYDLSKANIPIAQSLAEEGLVE